MAAVEQTRLHIFKRSQIGVQEQKHEHSKGEYKPAFIKEM